MVKLINLTPHEVVVFDPEGKKEILRIPPSGKICRVSTRMVKTGEIEVDGKKIPLFKVEYGEVEGLPEPKDDTIYIVSILVLNALKGKRRDIIAPNTNPGHVVRDEKGNILGVKSFISP